ncbi:MAG: MBL fold metallo-hydrolase, partial [Pedobacter sp.]
SPTPMKPDDVTYINLFATLLRKNPNKVPKGLIPSVKPDFSSVEGIKVIWFGHSSYFINIDGVRILVDPVFSERTSPFAFLGTKNFKGTDFIKPEDFPPLDIVLITHDHYDHMDYSSILKLKSKTKRFITSIGAGEHLEYWGVDKDKITELCWNEEVAVELLKFRAMPARHFTGRKFKRNLSAWSAFILQTPKGNLYLGGDSGYDAHFKAAGEKYGPFELAILECGQYNAYWPLIHMFPEQVVDAAKDLNAKVLMPVHWGKFTLAAHNWDEPVKRVWQAAVEKGQQLATPILGESVIVGVKHPNKQWWLKVDDR